MDTLQLSGIELWVRVGCTTAERAFAQRLEMDLHVEMPLDVAGQTDDLKETVDYASLVHHIQKEIQSKTFRLVEAVAESAVRVVWRFRRIQAVRVQVKKRALPGIQWAGVEIYRRRSSPV